MKRQTITIAVLVAVAVCGSVFIAAKAIVGTAAGLRAAPSEAAEPGPIESTGTEVAALAQELSNPEEPTRGSAVRTDPTIPYTAPAPPRQPTKQAEAPRKQSYTVTAVILDEAPTAILKSGSGSLVVQVGQQLDDGIVTAITANGVTVTSDKGEVTYSYSASQ